MKKSLLLLLTIILSTAYGYAQKVNKDKTEEDGSRVILSESYNMYRKMNSAAGFYLAYVRSSTGTEEWSFEVTLNEGKIIMDRGRKFLIKTDSGKIIELENDKEIGPADYDYNVTRYGTDYYIKPSYILTEDQIKELYTSNIVKIRIETNGGSFDREIKPKKFAKAVKEMYDAINTAKSKETSVYDNF